MTTCRRGMANEHTANVIYPIDDRTNHGPTLVVFVPGLAGNARQWALVLPQLDDLQADFARGAPLLPHPAFRGATPTATALASAYAEQLRRENRHDVIIAAHSVGTFVALEAARLSPIVKKVIAVNGGLTTPARFLDRPITEFRSRPRDCLNALRLFALVGTPAPPAVKRAIASRERWSRALFGNLVSDAALNSVERRCILAGEGGKPQALRTLWHNRHYWENFSKYAYQINSQIVFLVGEQDPVAGEADTRVMVRLLEHAQVDIDILPGVGHAAPVEAADAVSAAIRKSFDAL